MSSGTQVDMDWAGGGARRAGTGDAAYLTDEEILGIDPPSPNGGFGGQARHANNNGAGNGGQARLEMPPTWTIARRLAARLRRTGGMARTGGMRRWIRKARRLKPAPLRGCLLGWRRRRRILRMGRRRRRFGGASGVSRGVCFAGGGARRSRNCCLAGCAMLLSLREATQSVERIDAALFSGDARAQSEVVAEMARVNPAAFRSMFAEAARVLAGMGSTRQWRQEAGRQGALTERLQTN